MSDKDTIMNAIQASHDAHLSKIDALEDSLVNQELKAANDLVGFFSAPLLRVSRLGWSAA